MKKKTLIGSIIAVVLLTLVSFTSVVGYSSVKNAQEEIITSEYDFEYCKEYLFETMVEIYNNPDVKGLINSNNNNLFLTNSNHRLLMPFRRNTNKMSLSVEHFELLYNLGLKIVDRLGEDKVAELMENIEIETPDYLDELDAIVMGNDELKERIYTIIAINNEKVSTTGFEETPIICGILGVILLICLCIAAPIDFFIENILEPIGAYYLSWFLVILCLPISLIGVTSAFLFILGFLCLPPPYPY